MNLCCNNTAPVLLAPLCNITDQIVTYFLKLLRLNEHLQMCIQIQSLNRQLSTHANYFAEYATKNCDKLLLEGRRTIELTENKHGEVFFWKNLFGLQVRWQAT